jgi:hypothetical protein
MRIRSLYLLAILLAPLTPALGLATASAAELGDLTPLRAIVTETAALADKADLTGAAARLTDFETAWDSATPKLRTLNAEEWGVIDAAADQALGAVRAAPPVAATVKSSLAALVAAIDNPASAAPAAAAVPVGPVAVADANGHPVPCEDLLKQLRDAVAATPPAETVKAAVSDLEAKGIERCNADDDKRADAFFAQAIGMVRK